MPWYTIRSYKEHATETGLPWRNEVELFTESEINDEIAQAAMTAWRAFERAPTFNFIRFSDATMSSWSVEDESENPPDELFQFGGLSAVGNRTDAILAMPLEHTLNLSKTPFRGQKGKLSLRGCLETADVLSTPRGWVLLPAARAAFEAIIDPAWETLQNTLENIGMSVGMVSYPIVGWAEKPTAPGSKPKFKPVYGVELYERTIKNIKVRGAGKIQLRHS